MREEYEEHWGDDVKFTWRDWTKTAAGLLGLGVLIWWMTR